MSDDFGDNTKITAYIKDKLKYGSANIKLVKSLEQYPILWNLKM